jgi:hypothetical protein
MAHSDDDLPENVCLVEKVVLLIFLIAMTATCVEYAIEHYEIKRIASGQEVRR